MNCAHEQILVVVAISNMRDIMADEKKGYIRTLIDYMLVDPKGTDVGPDRLHGGNPAQRQRGPKGKCVDIHIPLPHRAWVGNCPCTQRRREKGAAMRLP